MIIIYLKNGVNIEFLSATSIKWELGSLNIFKGKKVVGCISQNEYVGWKLVEEGVLEIENKNSV